MTTQRIAATCSAATRASCSAMIIGFSPAAAARQVRGAGGEVDGAPQQERPARLGRDQVAAVHHAQDLAGGGQHGNVMHAALEHVQQDVADQAARPSTV